MKNKILKLVVLLLFPIITFGQYRYSDHKESYLILSTEFDVRNALVGSDVNPPAYDGVYNIAYRIKEFHAQASFENFSEIGFKSYALGLGYVMNRESAFQLMLMGQLGLINRDSDWIKRDHDVMISGSLQLEYHLRNFFIFGRTQLRYRGDLSRITNPEGYLGIAIKL